MKCLGIDYGTKKIGIAMSSGDVVSPLVILDNRFGHQIGKVAIDKIAKIVREENIKCIIVGLPIMNNEEGDMVRDIKVFVHKLKKIIASNTKIMFVDESHSSKIAINNAIKFDIPVRKRKDDHAIAACEILKRGLEE